MACFVSGYCYFTYDGGNRDQYDNFHGYINNEGYEQHVIYARQSGGGDVFGAFLAGTIFGGLYLGKMNSSFIS